MVIGHGSDVRLFMIYCGATRNEEYGLGGQGCDSGAGNNGWALRLQDQATMCFEVATLH